MRIAYDEVECTNYSMMILSSTHVVDLTVFKVFLDLLINVCMKFVNVSAYNAVLDTVWLTLVNCLLHAFVICLGIVAILLWNLIAYVCIIVCACVFVNSLFVRVFLANVCIVIMIAPVHVVSLRLIICLMCLCLSLHLC